MSNVIAFPRRKPLEDHEYPAYWGYMEKSYYEMRIEDGVSHEEAFAEWDKYARKGQADHELYRRMCDEAAARRAAPDVQPPAPTPTTPARERSLREIELAGDLLGYLLPRQRTHGIGASRRAEAEAARSDGGFYKKRLMTMRQLQRELTALIEREEIAWKQARTKAR